MKREFVKGGSCVQRNGWTCLSVNGSAKERGYAMGYFSAKDFGQVQEMLKFVVYDELGETWDFFIDASNKFFRDKIKHKYTELYEEIEGIAEGCCAAGTQTTAAEVLAWNNYFTLTGSWYPKYGGGGTGRSKEGGAKDHCSAFIANGDYTKDGKIVVAHNSFSDIIDGQYSKYIVDMNPTKGSRFIMQSGPCMIWSGTDFFVTSRGIIGTETTIGGFNAYENNWPIAFRIRQAMQYGESLDDYVNILLDGNSGDYANSWLFGDTHTNEIMRLELGCKYHNVERTNNGYFIGFNAAYDPRIRNKECTDSGINDVRRHQGARRVRLTDLMDENKGKIDVSLALKIIADHYDVYLNKVNPCSRTVCSHYDLDPREYMSDPSRPKPFQPRGALDGCVCDSSMAKNMAFMARFGRSCGQPFDAKKFCNDHRQWSYLLPYLHDLPTQPWIKVEIHDVKSITKHNRKIVKKTTTVKIKKQK